MSKLKSSWKSSIDDGQYRRKDSQFRNWITSDGRAGASGGAGFKAQAGRYHLYPNSLEMHDFSGSLNGQMQGIYLSPSHSKAIINNAVVGHLKPARREFLR